MEKNKLTLRDVELAYTKYTTTSDMQSKKEMQALFVRTYDVVEQENLTTITELERYIEGLQSKMPQLDPKKIAEAQDVIRRAENLKAQCSKVLGALHSGRMHDARVAIVNLGTTLDVESQRTKEDEVTKGR